MPLYIKDDATAALVAELASKRGISKQDAVRLAVQAELKRIAEAIRCRADRGLAKGTPDAALDRKEGGQGVLRRPVRQPLTVFVDASAMIAMIAMIAGERDADALADRFAAEPVRLCSAISVWKTVAGLCRTYRFSVPSARTASRASSR